jgi:hypothetical protein
MNPVPYLDSAECIEIDAKRVISELFSHNRGFVEFFLDCPPESKGLWLAQKVLFWLGYERTQIEGCKFPRH